MVPFVSAVCVTGLSPVVIADTLSVFGKIVLAILIQTGGLGYATFAIFLYVLFGGDIPFRQRDLAQESLNQANSKGIITLVKVVMLSSLIVEAIGTIILAWAFRTQAGSPREALGLGLFHAISAFNNAGFDLFGDSLMEWHDNLLVNMTVSC
jgi:trk system potassium uptake protein TrkH